MTGIAVALILGLVSFAQSHNAMHAAQESNTSALRSELAGYAQQMVSLDRKADERNGIAVSVLAGQAYQALRRTDADDLDLPAVTYRVISEIAAFDSEDVRVTEYLANRGIEAARGEGNAIEEARSERVLATVAAQGGNPSELEKHISRAIELTRSPDVRQNRDATYFTHAFAVFLAIRAADTASTPEDEAAACELARTYYEDFHGDIEKAFANQSLEVSRRAYLVRDHQAEEQICGASELTPKSLKLKEFVTIWIDNPERKSS